MFIVLDVNETTINFGWIEEVAFIWENLFFCKTESVLHFSNRSIWNSEIYIQRAKAEAFRR